MISAAKPERSDNDEETVCSSVELMWASTGKTVKLTYGSQTDPVIKVGLTHGQRSLGGKSALQPISLEKSPVEVQMDEIELRAGMLTPGAVWLRKLTIAGSVRSLMRLRHDSKSQLAIDSHRKTQ
jgi:hypothetical protein